MRARRLDDRLRRLERTLPRTPQARSVPYPREVVETWSENALLAAEALLARAGAENRGLTPDEERRLAEIACTA